MCCICRAFVNALFTWDESHMTSCLCATKYTQIDILISYYNQVKGEEEEDEALELKETTIKGQR